ncbi:eukaryotic translation initiation factor 3 subunit B-like [Papaver somniferum]|uniref:eukaryotic translation initiation factor 3 subunit B-like n=1 Tax=Papaver somniferum TaxID=3469 RepID=UPI000E6FAB1D|nr:eukaryotic translation initiation factor 3 subunit B-like [Papaver somniferum]
MATNIEWDPTGRYVATSVTSVHEMENGFNIWSFTGKLLYKISKDHLHQFSWRPRTPSFLPAGKGEEISKNLEKYSKKYETEDQDAAAQLHEKGRHNREMMQQEWDSWIKQWKQLHEEEKLERQQLLINGEASDDEASSYEAELVEVLKKSCCYLGVRPRVVSQSVNYFFILLPIYMLTNTIIIISQ